MSRVLVQCYTDGVPATCGDASVFPDERESVPAAAPPAFGSPAFLTALAEVRQVADTRTAEQTAIAKFWALPGGYVVAQSYNNQVATDLITAFHLDERRAAHALALLNMAVMDAFIACHDAKYTYWLLRPSMADPGIKLAIGFRTTRPIRPITRVSLAHRWRCSARCSRVERTSFGDWPRRRGSPGSTVVSTIGSTWRPA